MNMKWLIIAAIIIVIIIMIIAAIIFIFYVREASNPPEELPTPTELTVDKVESTREIVTETTVKQQSVLYIIGEWEDKLAVFKVGDVSPIFEYEVYLSTLPQDEQEKIRSGIEVYDEETLHSLLEDYIS